MPVHTLTGLTFPTLIVESFQHAIRGQSSQDDRATQLIPQCRPLGSQQKWKTPSQGGCSFLVAASGAPGLSENPCAINHSHAVRRKDLTTLSIATIWPGQGGHCHNPVLRGPEIRPPIRVRADACFAAPARVPGESERPARAGSGEGGLARAASPRLAEAPWAPAVAQER